MLLFLQSVSNPQLRLCRNKSVCEFIDQGSPRHKDSELLLTHASHAFRKLLVGREMNVSEFCYRVAHHAVDIPGKFAGLDVCNGCAKMLTGYGAHQLFAAIPGK